MTQARIAVIEDDKIQQRILKDMLQDVFSVQIYGGYAEAIHNFCGPGVAKPDLILCDMTLADGDGIALRHELQKHESMQSCPFIFLTGLEDGKVRRQAIDSGIDDYLKKPIEKHALIEALDRTLKRSKQLQQAGDERLNQQLNEPLHPFVPERIGPYRLTLAHRQVIAGGGDFVFHLKIGETDFIILGDVMGHGAPAKFFLHAYAGYLYGMTRSFRHHDIAPSAADLLRLLNRTIATDSFLQRWSLTCAVICLPGDKTPSLAHAGHPFIWLLAQGKATPIGGKSAMPGLSDNASYTDTAFDLKRTERLIITTDGAAIRHGDLPHDSTTLGLLKQLMKESDPKDDATVLVIERA